jgi:hypothetical protein
MNCLSFVQKNRDDLNFMLKMWPATQDPKKGYIFVQEKLQPPTGKSEPVVNAAISAGCWDIFRTVVHEYLHAATSPTYTKAADKAPGKREALIEGATDFFHLRVWNKIKGTISKNRSLQETVQGFYDPEFNVRPVDKNYDIYKQVEQINSVVDVLGKKGFSNLAAAYFLGEVELLGLEKP